jgi:hypothetical protein
MIEGMPTCCGTCPFKRTTPAGHLGGSPPEVYIGQARASMSLMCHSCYEPGVDPKEQDPSKVPQCAGAAKFRANCGVADLMAPGTHALPEDKETVFADWAEFFAHHYCIDLKVARAVLRNIPPEDFAERELRKARYIYIIPKGTV